MRRPVRAALLTIAVAVIAAVPVRATATATASGPSLSVPILMYHYIRSNPREADELGSRLSVQPINFAEQMALLDDNGWHTVSMAQLMDAVDTGTPLPSKPIVLTFDDGYSDFATVAAPVMRAFGLTGTTYVVPDFIGTPNYMTQEQLHEVVTRGMEIGAHTMTHPNLAQLSDQQAAAQITQSRQTLQAWTGQKVDTFAYPYGAYNGSTPGLVANAGFRSAVTTAYGTAESAGNRDTLPRVRISGGESLSTFGQKLGIAVPPAGDGAFWQRVQAEAAAALRGPTVGVAASPSGKGYGMFDFDGLVHSFGDFPSSGSATDLTLNAPITAGTVTPSGKGYWLAAADGGVFPYGDATGYGSMGGMVLNRPIVSMAVTASGNGYWLVAADGGVFPFGDANGYGSMGGMVLNRPIVAAVATHTGLGYWLVAADGGVFPFGDAVGYGSTASVRLNQPVVGAAGTADDLGYWLVAADGGIFSFGDAVGYGSTGGIVINSPAVGMARTPAGDGYWLVCGDGGVFPFGAAQGYGSAA